MENPKLEPNPAIEKRRSDLGVRFFRSKMQRLILDVRLKAWQGEYPGVDPSELDAAIKIMAGRIEENIGNFLRVVDLMTSPESEEPLRLTNLCLQETKDAGVFYQLGNVESELTGDLVEVVRNIFRLSSEAVSDVHLRTIVIGLMVTRRWRLNSREFCTSLIDPDFQESDWKHVLKMVQLAKLFQEVAGIKSEDMTLVLWTILLHDLSEFVVGDFSKAELTQDAKISKIVGELFKTIEAMVPISLAVAKVAVFKFFQKILICYDERGLPSKESSSLPNHYVGFLDKLDSLLTIVAIFIVPTFDSKSQELGYPEFLPTAIGDAWRTLETYAQCLSGLEYSSDIETAEYQSIILKMIVRMFKTLDRQQQLQVSKIDRPKSRVTKITLLDLPAKMVEMCDPQKYPTVSKLVGQAYLEWWGDGEKVFEEVLN